MRRHLHDVSAPSDPVAGDLPPGQHLTRGFPNEPGEAAPAIDLDEWTFTLEYRSGATREWDWPAFRALPSEQLVVDLHSVEGWSKLATTWEGVPLRILFAGVAVTGKYAHVDTYGMFTTNLPVDDLLEMPTWLAFNYEGEPLAAERGGPVRLLVPHLYLWKSAKWVRRITTSARDRPGIREREGLHNYGDPWREQRYRHTSPVEGEPS